MTSLPATPPPKRLGLVIDLDICVGCHACAVSCKEWNDGGAAGPLTDPEPYGALPTGTWFNRIHGYEVTEGERSYTLHFPRSCLHCEDAVCVTVCPTGASFKRTEDGIVLVDDHKCIGCGLCAWACPYGARELDTGSGTMKKCTLCVDRIEDETLEPSRRVPACVSACPTHARHFGDLADPASHVSRIVAERGGVAPMAELGYRPTNRYLPARGRNDAAQCASVAPLPEAKGKGLFGWIDRLLSD
jgi:Fe-S-cluster-containing dehydrogenase component